ncbi:MAG: hypothetical protein AABX07_05795 [Nanoarchaeota archaeon]
MAQNRSKLIELFIGNISNAVVHDVLERAVGKELMAEKYRKELTTSFEIAKKYREKINPLNRPLSEKDTEYIRVKIVNKAKAELAIRISKGYKNIDLLLIELLVDKALRSTKIV